jgi:hypothetical protein
MLGLEYVLLNTLGEALGTFIYRIVLATFLTIEAITTEFFYRVMWGIPLYA